MPGNLPLLASSSLVVFRAYPPGQCYSCSWHAPSVSGGGGGGGGTCNPREACLPRRQGWRQGPGGGGQAGLGGACPSVSYSLLCVIVNVIPSLHLYSLSSSSIPVYPLEKPAMTMPPSCPSPYLQKEKLGEHTSGQVENRQWGSDT